MSVIINFAGLFYSLNRISPKHHYFLNTPSSFLFFSEVLAKIKTPQWAKLVIGKEEIYLKRRMVESLPNDVLYKQLKPSISGNRKKVINE